MIKSGQMTNESEVIVGMSHQRAQSNRTSLINPSLNATGEIQSRGQPVPSARVSALACSSTTEDPNMFDEKQATPFRISNDKQVKIRGKTPIS